MLLLLLDSLLLIFITFSLGSIIKALFGKWFSTQLQTEFIENFILGLAASAAYFNLLSFVAPVNYVALVPLFFISLLWQWKQRELSLFRIRLFYDQFSATGRVLLFLLIMLFLYYFLLPPFNIDSPDYHYQSVYWFETQKIIPGLGNVHGRLAFNAITFILSAPYSFTHVVGESLYPLNGVLVSLFYFWLLRNILARRNNWSSIVYILVAFFLFRPLLANIPSPASEPLVTITVAVVFLRLIDVIRNKKHKQLSYLITPICISLFAVTAKLTSLPLLLVPALCILFFLKNQRFIFYGKLAIIACIILLPWLARNVVLSGYLVYPLYQLDLFNVDWKVPRDVAYMDYALGTYASRGRFDTDPNVYTAFNWIWPWIKTHTQPKKWIDLIIFILCFSSPFTWYFVRKTKEINTAMFLLWACAFTGALVWLYKAPEYRFGLSFLLVSFAIPMLTLFEHLPLKEKLFNRISITIFLLFSFYYFIRPFNKHPRLHSHGINTLWLKPLKDSLYYSPVNMSTFQFQDLGQGVKLYMKDKTHNAVHIKDQPCALWYYGKIEMRGTKIDDGFRNKTLEIRQAYPWLFTYQP
jgi:hypothetical protein